jgi:DNA-binding NarL/FixJ family response regulator
MTASPRPARAVRIANVEDDPRYRESLVRVFEAARGFALAGTFGAAEPALEAAGRGAEWDLVVMDIGLPGMGGIEATRRLKRVRPALAVVMLTVFEDPPTILEAICAGADGYTLKKTPAPELLELLRSVAEGGAPLTPGVARQVLGLVRAGRLKAAPAPTTAPTAATGLPDADEPSVALTPREQDVLRALTRGLSYKQVAGELALSIDTVRTHIRALYKKLQVHSVAEAVGRALREGIV